MVVYQNSHCSGPASCGRIVQMNIEKRLILKTVLIYIYNSSIILSCKYKLYNQNMSNLLFHNLLILISDYLKIVYICLKNYYK